MEQIKTKPLNQVQCIGLNDAFLLRDDLRPVLRLFMNDVLAGFLFV